jgi:hypothetical protein
VGFLDALLGRTKPAQPDLDHLFGLPGAEITLQAAEGMKASTTAAVCFKPASAQSFADTEKELVELLNLDVDGTAPSGDKAMLSNQEDEFGYRWVIVESSDFNSLVTRVHLVNSTLEDHGWGPQLLCSAFAFHPGSPAAAGSAPVAYLIYLYKRGSFYPFVPTDGEHRDNEMELRLQNELGDDLAIEKDLDRWFPIWKLPIS